MTNRRLTILLHWSTVLVLLIMVKSGVSDETVRWVFVGIVTVWIAMAGIKGMRSKPGPKLQGKLRQAYPWMHRALYGVMAGTAAANAAVLLGVMPVRVGWVSLLVLFAVGLLHGLFQFWRHTALFDGALRTITPRFLHNVF